MDVEKRTWKTPRQEVASKRTKTWSARKNDLGAEKMTLASFEV
jgi:hypothetical protein